jgi:hypothetical protein
LDKVRVEYRWFCLPYIALLEKGRLAIAAEPLLLIHDVWKDGQVNGRGTDHPDMALDDFIAMHKEGNGTLFTDRRTPITAVVEFSPTELYPAVMQRLEKKYAVRRIMV